LISIEAAHSFIVSSAADELTGTCVTPWTRDIRYESLAAERPSAGF
jgi:hypothetical protein